MNEDRQTQIVRKLYCTSIGRLSLAVITKPWVSRAAGIYMDSALSRAHIRRFVKDNNIDLEQYEPKSYKSFNDFFTRKIRPENRPVCTDDNLLIAPCDGMMSMRRITEDSEFEIKGQKYTMANLVRSSNVAKRYEGGTMVVIRLTVSDYHRYHYPATGRKSINNRIRGVLHTVNPVAAEKEPLYCENAREFFELQTETFGNILMIQVGALLVGRIHNCHQQCDVVRGQEAGWF